MEFLESLLAVVAPHSCINCNTEGQPWCFNCSQRLAYKQPSCFGCNRLNQTGRTCPACRRKSDLAGVVVAYRYDGVIRELVQRLKYQNQVAVATDLARQLSPLLSPANYDVVTAVPASPSRYRHRGYHQAELIAKRAATRLGLPYRPILGRLEVESQVGASRNQRFQHVQGSFWVKTVSAVAGQRVLIVDDVLTTGATLSEAARVLGAAGAKSVWGAVVAKH